MWFQKFNSFHLAFQQGVEDYIGLDEFSGKLVHLHLHWQLVIGERNIKSIRVPWENLFLERRVFDKI